MVTSPVPRETSPEWVAASTGLVDGRAAKNLVVFGRRAAGWNSTTAYGDVSDYLDTTQDKSNAVVLGTTYYLRSSSASDTSDGVGARTVRVVYLDAAGAEQVATVTLNGTTAVSLGNAISYIQWMEVATVGSSASAVGNLAISTVTGAPTVAQTVEYVRAGYNRSRSGRYKVPAGHVAYVGEWDIGCTGGGDQDMVLLATTFGDDSSLTTVFHVKDSFYLAHDTNAGGLHLHWCRLPAGAEVKVSSIPTAAGAGNRADATVHVLLVAA